MCGIAGIAGADVAGHAGAETVAAMCDAMKSRGPDDWGMTSHADAVLGMRRLAIVDIHGGHQPMHNEDESCVLVFNGEIYNAPALRDGLEREGVRFKTRSDTEVILRLYERNPEDVEAHLRGMWAFAIHDRRRRRLVLSRDRFGIKPLFLAQAPGRVAFSSELRGFAPLRSRDGFARCFAFNAGAAHAMLSWAYVPEEETIYAGVNRVPPATRSVIDLSSGRRSDVTFWKLRPSADARSTRSLSEACELVEPILDRAVREHLESDVPVATFLSGGIDSSLVAAHAADRSSRPIEAFTAAFTDPRFDESGAAKETAERLGMRLQVEHLDEHVLRSSLADALIAQDEPFGDASSLAVFALSRRVARTHKVVLSGDGGDEAFGGYRKHRIVRLRERLRRHGLVRGALRGVLSMLPQTTDRTRGWTETLRTAERLARGLAPTDSEAYVAITQVGSLRQTESLVTDTTDTGRFERAARERFDHLTGSQLGRTLACDLANPLVNDMLVKVDRATMACSLEARVPLLDHELVEAGIGLPASFTAGVRGKEVLRALHARRFGARLAGLPKHGFNVPIEQWLRTSLSPACDELFSTRRLDHFGILRSAELGGGRWRKWSAQNPLVLWNAFALAAWLELACGEGHEALREMLARTPSASRKSATADMRAAGG